MIVLDENIHQQRILADIAAWYRGQVRSITTLRAHTLIKDDVIPTLLQSAQQPTFVTTNVTDFWPYVSAHSRYCIICVPIPNERLHALSLLLRQLMRLPEFDTKAKRMGKVIRMSPNQLQYYEKHPGSVTHISTWPDGSD